MHPQQSSRIDLGDLKAQLFKKIGHEKAKKYFYYLNRFLSQKLSKNEFDSFCIRTFGKENIRLHNQLIRSILKNACQAKTPPPIPEVGPTKYSVQTGKDSPDGQAVPIWSNGVLSVSPRKARSGMRDRKFRDRPSPLGPNGKVENLLHQSVGTEDDSGGKNHLENGVLNPCDYQRPTQHLHEQPENDKEGSTQRQQDRLRIPCKERAQTVAEDGEEVEQDSHQNFSRSPLLAPLGIPMCSASVGGARKTSPLASSGHFVSIYDIGGLYDTETLKKRMELIAASQGLGGVTLDCANMLNNMLDVYLKRLIKSCVELVGARSNHDPRKYPVHKHQAQGKIPNGMWQTNHISTQGCSGPAELVQEQRPRGSISFLDFKVAMELNPQQLGEDWPLLLEKISMHSFEG